MRDFEAKGELIEAALAVIPDLLEVHPNHAHSDAEAELHDDQLKEKATQYVRVLGLKVEDGYTPIEIENSIRNQIIGYLKGKASTRRVEMANASVGPANALYRQAETLDRTAQILELEATDG